MAFAFRIRPVAQERAVGGLDELAVFVLEDLLAMVMPAQVLLEGLVPVQRRPAQTLDLMRHPREPIRQRHAAQGFGLAQNLLLDRIQIESLRLGLIHCD